jgi:hypothetical protein
MVTLTSPSSSNNSDVLLRAILADRQRHAEQPKYEAAHCFVCDRTFAPKPPAGDNSTRLCSEICRTAFDNGFPPYEAQVSVFSIPIHNWMVIAGPPGVEVGASYYGPLLDRKRPSQKGKLTADELIRPRRLCQSCSTPLPVWRNGKRVPVSRKFCDMCRR